MRPTGGSAKPVLETLLQVVRGSQDPVQRDRFADCGHPALTEPRLWSHDHLRGHRMLLVAGFGTN